MTRLRDKLALRLHLAVGLDVLDSWVLLDLGFVLLWNLGREAL